MTLCNKYALELVRDIIPTSSCEIETKLVDLILWAYEQGSIEGIEAYREDENPTEQQEWERSR